MMFSSSNRLPKPGKGKGQADKPVSSLEKVAVAMQQVKDKRRGGPTSMMDRLRGERFICSDIGDSESSDDELEGAAEPVGLFSPLWGRPRMSMESKKTGKKREKIEPNGKGAYNCSHCHGRGNWEANRGVKHNAAKCEDKRKGLPACPCPRLECGGCGLFNRKHPAKCPNDCKKRTLEPREDKTAKTFTSKMQDLLVNLELASADVSLCVEETHKMAFTQAGFLWQDHPLNEKNRKTGASSFTGKHFLVQEDSIPDEHLRCLGREGLLELARSSFSRYMGPGEKEKGTIKLDLLQRIHSIMKEKGFIKKRPLLTHEELKERRAKKDDATDLARSAALEHASQFVDSDPGNPDDSADEADGLINHNPPVWSPPRPPPMTEVDFPDCPEADFGGPERGSGEGAARGPDNSPPSAKSPAVSMREREDALDVQSALPPTSNSRLECATRRPDPGPPSAKRPFVPHIPHVETPALQPPSPAFSPVSSRLKDVEQMPNSLSRANLPSVNAPLAEASDAQPPPPICPTSRDDVGRTSSSRSSNALRKVLINEPSLRIMHSWGLKEALRVHDPDACPEDPAEFDVMLAVIRESQYDEPRQLILQELLRKDEAAVVSCTDVAASRTELVSILSRIQSLEEEQEAARVAVQRAEDELARARASEESIKTSILAVTSQRVAAEEKLEKSTFRRVLNLLLSRRPPETTSAHEVSIPQHGADAAPSTHRPSSVLDVLTRAQACPGPNFSAGSPSRMSEPSGSGTGTFTDPSFEEPEPAPLSPRTENKPASVEAAQQSQPFKKKRRGNRAGSHVAARQQKHAGGATDAREDGRHGGRQDLHRGAGGNRDDGGMAGGRRQQPARYLGAGIQGPTFFDSHELLLRFAVCLVPLFDCTPCGPNLGSDRF